MKRTISLWLGVLAMAFLPAIAQKPDAPTGPTVKVHGQITNPTGAPQAGGTVEFVMITRAASGPGLSAQTADQGTFKVDSSGFYQGQVVAGKYTVIYRSEGMAKDKQADVYQDVNVQGTDFTQDIDMSRQAYIDKLPPEEKKQLEEMRKKNAEAMKANVVIKHLNEDLKQVGTLFHEADGARATAIQQLGKGATKAAVDAKTEELKNEKYTQI